MPLSSNVRVYKNHVMARQGATKILS